MLLSDSNIQNKVIVSGMRATGALHLGHYHGVLKNWIKLQEKYKCLFFVADIHALTTHYEDPACIESSTLEMVITWLSAGLDPKFCHLFIQSDIPEHAELHLLLSMITPLGWLERVPTYKDQQQKLKEKDLSTYGFLGYPLLQTADVLIYKAAYVPVGEDQVPHLEFSREIARRFNYLYGRHDGIDKIILPEPQALLTETSKFPGLDGQKMSKSYGNTIAILDTPEVVEQKIKVMPTDPARIRRQDPGEPQKCPVWAFHAIYANDTQKEWVQTGCRTAGIGCLECKKVLINAIQMEQEPMRVKAQMYRNNVELVQNIIHEGTQAARVMANETLAEVRDVMGLKKK